MGQVIDFKQAREDHYGTPAKVSISLKRLARENRRELLTYYPNVRFWTKDINLNQYAYFLYLHLAIRKELEAEFEKVGDRFNVVNLFNNHNKSFELRNYAAPLFCHSELISNDLQKLDTPLYKTKQIETKAAELIAYIHRTAQVYSLALLGIAYMLEDNLCNFGPTIANALIKQTNHSDSDNNPLVTIPKDACSYLNSYKSKRQLLWGFRQSLDKINDFQSQANIVIAASITYQIHRDLLDPRAIRKGSSKS